MKLSFDHVDVLADGSLTGKLNGAEILTKYMVRAGVNRVFGVPGALLLPLFDALLAEDGIEVVQAKHEQGAAFMADGYARKEGFAACCGTMGPGALNLITGVAAAYMDSVPLLIITSQAYSADEGKGACQEGTGEGRTPDHNRVFESLTKYSRRISQVAQLPFFVQKAMRVARSGRPGPVHLDIPADVFVDFCEARIPGRSSLAPVRGPCCDEETLGRIEDQLLQARFPVILAGNGVRLARCWDELRRFSSAAGIPVATTLMGKGAVPESSPSSVGCIGVYGQAVANKIVFEMSDCILALGVSFQEFATCGWNPSLARKRIIQVDIDPEELGKNYPAEGVVACVGQVLCGLNRVRASQGERSVHSQRDAMSRCVARLKKEMGYYCSFNRSNSTWLQPEEVVQTIARQIGPQDVLCADVGENAYWAELLCQCEAPEHYMINGGLGSMGHGVAASVGVGFAVKGEGQAYCICGDGGFLMSGQEVATAVQYHVPVVWCILNNACYGANKRLQEAVFGRRFVATDLPDVDFAAMGRSMGATSFSVKNVGQLRHALAAADAADGPYVLDISVDHDYGPSKRKTQPERSSCA